MQGSVDLHLDTQKGHQEAMQPVSLGSVSGGWQHTRSSGIQSLASMVSFMEVVTLIAYPLWYTVSTRVVLATRPPMTASAGWCGVVWCGVVWCGVVWCGVVWCGVVWCGVVWCGVPKALLSNGNGRDALHTGKTGGLCV